jgi:hypothetical protein
MHIAVLLVACAFLVSISHAQILGSSIMQVQHAPLTL